MVLYYVYVYTCSYNHSSNVDVRRELSEQMQDLEFEGRLTIHLQELYIGTMNLDARFSMTPNPAESI